MYKNKKIGAIVIARQGSSRLPGKALKKIVNKSIIELIIERLRNINLIDEIIIATSDLRIDDPIEDEARKLNVKYFRGDAENVLNRLYMAAKSFDIDIVYEIGGDCPIVDEEIFLKGYKLFLSGGYDFVHNFSPTTYPDGLDCPILTFKCLKKMNDNAILQSHKIHPFSYIFTYPEKFLFKEFTSKIDYSYIRLTLDYNEDLLFLKYIYENLYYKKFNFSLKEIVNLIKKDKKVLKMNCQYIQPSSPEGYWNTLAYIKDLHEDIKDLIDQGHQASQNKNNKNAKDLYNEVINLVKKLKSRVEHFDKNR